MVDVFVEGDAIETGSAVDNDFVRVEGNLVTDNDDSSLVFIEGEGVGVLDTDFDHEWIHDEGSGTTLADSGTSATVLDGTINGAAWQSGDGSGGTHLEYNRSNDDYTQLPTGAKSELAHFANSGAGTLFTWVRPGDVTTNPSGGIARGVVLGSRLGQAATDTINWALSVEDDYSVSWQVGDDTAANGVVDLSSSANAVAQGAWSSIGIREDGSTAYLYLGGPNSSLSQVASASLSTSSGDHEEEVQFGAARASGGALNSFETYDGDIDQTWVTSQDIGESELQDWHDTTAPDY